MYVRTWKEISERRKIPCGESTGDITGVMAKTASGQVRIDWECTGVGRWRGTGGWGIRGDVGTHGHLHRIR